LLIAGLLCLLWAPAVCSSEATWSGRIEAVDEILRPMAPEGERELLVAMVADFDANIKRSRAALARSIPEERWLHEADLIAWTEARDRARLAVGGVVRVGGRKLLFRDVPVATGALPGSDAYVLVLEEEGNRMLARWPQLLFGGVDRFGEKEGAYVLTPTKESMTGNELGDGRFQIEIPTEDGVTWTVEYKTGLPNPFAATRTVEVTPESLEAKLAQLPGMPLRISRPLGGGVTWLSRVTAVEAGPVGEAELWQHLP
jgi:hypothetical protein